MRNVLIVFLVIGVLITIAILMLKLFGSDTRDELVTAPADAAAARPIDAAIVDAGPNKDDIIALSRFGFFSITANAKTTIWIDNKNIGETPLTRLPLTPGPHKVRAVGPKNKIKMFDIKIYGGRDTEEDAITW